MDKFKRRFDAVVVGSGAGAGPVIYELAKAGHSVLVLEKGPWFFTKDFRKDELVATRRSVYTPNLKDEFHELEYYDSFGDLMSETTFESGWDFWNGNMVGGSSNLMSGYFQRMKPVDFRLLSEYGEIPGAHVVDWPITYEDLEPYYEKVERIVGVSGKVVKHKYQEPRSTSDFPYPPLKENIVSSFIDRAAKITGYEIIPTPRAILSAPKGDRKSCYYSHYCGSYGCASDAKGSSRVSLIHKAMKTGNVTVQTGAHVYHLETDGSYRIKKAWFIIPSGEKYFAEGKVFVVAAQAIETSRLMLLSKNPEFPNGIANNNGLVGKNLIFSAGGTGYGIIDLDDFDEQTAREIMKPGLFINRTMHYFYEVEDPQTGRKIKGGTVDFLFEHANPVPKALKQKWEGDKWIYGKKWKEKIHRYFTRQRRLNFEIFVDWLPHDDCFVSLSPKHKDKYGLPVAKIRIEGHPHQLKVGKILAEKSEQVFKAMGLKDISSHISNSPPQNLQAGGMRFGNDPKNSVLDKYCRAHEVDNLYVTDGSFMPTGGSVTFTWTIYANSFRVADYINKEVL